MSRNADTPRQSRRLTPWPHSVSPRTQPPSVRTMEDQPFAYYQHSQQLSSYSVASYASQPYESEFAAGDGHPFADHNFPGVSAQGDSQGWPASYPVSGNTVSFQRRGDMSDGASDLQKPEISGGERPARLRLDVNFGTSSVPNFEATASLASPLNLPTLATMPTGYPTSAGSYNAPSTSPTYDMNHDRSRHGLHPSLAVSNDSAYFIGMHANQQALPSQPASAAYPSQHSEPIAQHHQQYAPSSSPRSHLHPQSASPHGPATPRGGLGLPCAPSSITSGSARSISPASTTATSAQPLDFASLASLPGEQDFGTSSGQSSTLLVDRASKPVAAAARSPGPDRSSAGGHSISPIRRRAGKQRLNDARRKEICTYARDRPKARQEDIALQYGVERSTISKILKNKDKWLALNTHTHKSAPVKHRPSKFPEIEAELLKWVRDCQESDTVITDTRIKAQARLCATAIGLPDGKFKASSGWIENFKARNNLTRRSQGERGSSTAEEHDDTEHMDEDEDVHISASQSTHIEDDDSFGAGQTSLSLSASSLAQADSALGPLNTSFSTFSTESVASSSQNLSLFVSGTPMSSSASSFASSPSGGTMHHATSDRSHSHPYSLAIRAVGQSYTPSNSPQLGGSPVQPLSPGLDTRFANTPMSTPLLRYPTPLSASTPASASPLSMVNAHRTPMSHSRHPSDTSAFSFDASLPRSADAPHRLGHQGAPIAGVGQTLTALDNVLAFLRHPQAADFASQPERMMIEAVRSRLAESIRQARQ